MELERKFSNKWVIKPTPELIENIGARYNWDADDKGEKGEYDKYVNGYIENTNFYARISTQYEQFDVLIRQKNKKELSLQCECHMSSFMGEYSVCQHTYMALRYLGDNFEELIFDAYMRKERISTILNNMSNSQAMEFLSAVLKEDYDIYQQFIKMFKAYDNTTANKSYDLAIDRLYYTATDTSSKKIPESLNFNDHFDRTQYDNAADSAMAYRAMSESIHRNMHLVDDSDGYYADCIVESIECMVESILELANKKDHIKYITTMMTKMPKNMSRHYRMALETICTTDEDMDYLDSLLQTIAKTIKEDKTITSEQIAEVSLAQIFILEERGEEEKERKIMQILADTYHLDSLLRTKYIRYLGKRGKNDEDNSTHTKIITQIVSEFPDDSDIASVALSTYDNANPEYRKLATKLFVSTGDWKYYSKIKNSHSWSVSDTVSDLTKIGEERKSIEVYMKEKMHNDAMKILESKKKLSLLSLFVDSLGKKYSKRYFDAYAPLVQNLATQKPNNKNQKNNNKTIKNVTRKILKRISADQSTDEKFNARMRKHLIHIKMLKDKRYEDLLKIIRSKNSKNKPLLKAIRDL